MADASGPREEWNFKAFVRHYNDFAREFGGWNFHVPDFTEEKLHKYDKVPICTSLRDFARIRFQLDQQL